MTSIAALTAGQKAFAYEKDPIFYCLSVDRLRKLASLRKNNKNAPVSRESCNRIHGKQIHAGAANVEDKMSTHQTLTKFMT